MKSCLKLFLFVVCVAVASGSVLANEKERNKIRKAVNQTLSKLYEVQPSAKSTIEKAAGYAVFNNTGMKILVIGGGRGNSSRKFDRQGDLYENAGNSGLFGYGHQEIQCHFRI